MSKFCGCRECEAEERDRRGRGTGIGLGLLAVVGLMWLLAFVGGGW